jgi:prepilin-type N-terminal cleavage/methylation domain-containing protein
LRRDESGYSLVEVIVAMMILAIAILPMVSMFDAGLRAVALGGNYDKARALAGKQLEVAKSLPYSEVRDAFPVTPSTPDATGVYQSGNLTDPQFGGLTYMVRKEYVALVAGSIQPGETARSLRRMMQVTVVVRWSGGEYTTTGLVARSGS